MKKLFRHDLDFGRTIEYVKDNLKGASTLSDELLNSIDLTKGSFFTLLPEGSDLQRIYEFVAGVVLPQNPDIGYKVNGKNATYSLVPSIRNELSVLILRRLKQNKNFTCVFDDALRKMSDPGLELRNIIYNYKEEVCYIFNDLYINENLILDCLEKSSSSFWHSLGILSKIDLSDFDSRELSLGDLKKISANAVEIIIGAYDSEGYVFWERSRQNS